MGAGQLARSFARRVLPTPVYDRLKPCYSGARLLTSVLKGYRTFVKTGITPDRSFFDMRELYCLTNGRFNDSWAYLTGFVHPPYRIDPASGVLGDLSRREIESIGSVIEENGYHVFEKRLPGDVCDRLTEYALTTPAKPLYRKTEGDSESNGAQRVVYDRSNPIAVLYDFDVQSVCEHPVVQQLQTDLSLLAVAQAYFGCRPVLDPVTMWWSTPYLRGEANAEAAQLYHFDMDRIKFLKFFFYLKDVGPENGPHCYVAKSHKRKPKQLLRDGRISDEELGQYYPKDAFVEITGPRGSILAVDTRGFHKGKPLRSGDRLMLQLEYVTDRFGSNYWPRIRLNEKFSSEFRQLAGRYKRTFSNYEAQ